MNLFSCLRGACVALVFLLAGCGDPPPEEVAQTCGCQTMTVRRVANTMSGVYCSNSGLPTSSPHCVAATPPPGPAGPPVPGPAAPIPPCTGTETAFQCPLGSLTPKPNATPPITRFVFGFEIVADLVPGPAVNPALCTEGQVLRSSTLVNATPPPLDNPAVQNTPAPGVPIVLPRQPGSVPPQLTFNTVAAGQPVPQMTAANWGSDGYTEPQVYKVHEQTKIRWLDLPGTIAVAPVTSLLDETEFVSFVIGRQNAGTCWCQFRIQHRYDVATGAVSGPGARLIDGLNCKVP